MASDGWPAGAIGARLRFEPLVSETAFLALLLLVYVGLAPFATRDAAALATGQDMNTGAGDLARQACYLLVFGAIAAGAYYKRGLQAFTSIPASLTLLLAWCLLSALWADEPGVAFRRAGLEIVVVFSAMLSVGTLGTERSLKLLRLVLAGVLIVNWLSILLIVQAVHLPGEADPQIVGDWRGLYFHKNIAGSVSAISAIVFLFFAAGTRRWLDLLLALAAAAFAGMTHSKTSLILLPVALLLGGAYYVAALRPLNRQIVVVAFAFALVIAATVLLVEWDSIARIFADPQALTGRIAIWQAEYAYIRDHPWLGSGFGTFANTGEHSPIYIYAGSAWIGNAAHGHNGYLQLLVTTGVVGFALAMMGLVVAPILVFWKSSTNIKVLSLLFTIFVFVVLHNIVESDFLEGDAPLWVTFLLVIAMLYRQGKRTVT